jgi:[protein-PII] uridylyltransferase
MICTSLTDARLMAGNADLYESFMRRFRQWVGWRRGKLLFGIRQSRDEERARYGETVFLLEPNIKRSQGTLRDLQLLRWTGFARYGLREPRQLFEAGLLSEEDFKTIERANEFLLWLRNELHFSAGQANDVLNRSEQVRIAELRGYQSRPGLMAVEQFMQDYFRHTSQASHVVTQFLAKATSRERAVKVVTMLFGHRIEDDFFVGPLGMMPTRRGFHRLRGDLTAIMRMVDLSNLHDAPIAPAAWERIRAEVPRLPGYVSPEACGHFLSLMANPTRLGPLLHDLHDVGLLERFVPEFARARGLLQFNQYHKYTVDEHCIRAVDFATRLIDESRPVGREFKLVGRVYRGIADKHLLHLALLIHDLGKGLLEDHREVGLKIAEQTGQRLGLRNHEIETLKFLVHKHLRMNHLAFRRDTSDEELVVRFAVQVGSPELLQMLYVLTAADLGAVGPDVWDGWKAEVLTDLYHRAMQQLAGDSPATTVDQVFDRRREEIRVCLGPLHDDPWFARHVEKLSAAYLSATPPQQVAADLRILHDLAPDGVHADAQYLAETATVQVTVGTTERVARGIFHRLTGALSSLGLEIRSAQIHTLADGLVLDRFSVHDPDFAGESPPTRLAEINHALEQSLLTPGSQPPTFRRTWLLGGQRQFPGPKPQTRVNTDNSTSDRYTIIDVFSLDRTGLLYAITRALFELNLSVWRAKIGTYLDQVVDVFYVTDQQDRKVKDQKTLETIRDRLLEVIEADEAK